MTLFKSLTKLLILSLTRPTLRCFMCAIRASNLATYAPGSRSAARCPTEPRGRNWYQLMKENRCIFLPIPRKTASVSFRKNQRNQIVRLDNRDEYAHSLTVATERSPLSCPRGHGLSVVPTRSWVFRRMSACVSIGTRTQTQGAAARPGPPSHHCPSGW